MTLEEIEHRRAALAAESHGYQCAIDILKARKAALEAQAARPDYMAAVRQIVGR